MAVRLTSSILHFAPILATILRDRVYQIQRSHAAIVCHTESRTGSQQIIVFVPKGSEWN